MSIKRYLKLQIHTIGRKVKRSVFLNKYFPKFKDPVYWSGDRKSFARAGFTGAVCMMLPVPFQMVLGSIFAYYVRANIPLSSALAWITNPLTMGPIWYGGYQFGTLILNTPSMDSLIANNQNITIASAEWFSVVFPHIWKPFFLGNTLLGILIGVIFYLSILHYPDFVRILKKGLHKTPTVK